MKLYYNRTLAVLNQWKLIFALWWIEKCDGNREEFFCGISFQLTSFKILKKLDWCNDYFKFRHTLWHFAVILLDIKQKYEKVINTMFKRIHNHQNFSSNNKIVSSLLIMATSCYLILALNFLHILFVLLW